MKKKETKRKQNIFFTAEVFGMALALFSVLGLLCLITGNLIFGDEIGVPVLRFFLGVSGYLSFPILALLTFFGIKLLLGFKIQNVAVKKTIWASCTYAFIIGLILQSALTDLSVKTIGEYINACYQSGMSYASSTAGGVFLGSISYFMASVLSPAGAYVLYALALALFTLYLSRNKIGEMISERNKEATDDQREAKEKPGKQKKFFVPLNLLKNNKASTNEASPELAVTHSNSFEEPAQPKKNVIFGGGKFELRDSKDKNKSSNNLRILFGEQDGIKAFAPKNSKPEGLFGSPIESERSYRESYDRDLDKKTDFIRTPYTTTERPAVTSPMGDSPRSERRDYYSTSENESLNIDISQPESDIYVVRGTPKERESISSFDKWQGVKIRLTIIVIIAIDLLKPITIQFVTDFLVQTKNIIVTDLVAQTKNIIVIDFLAQMKILALA